MAWGPHRKSAPPPITCLLSPSPANLHCLLHLAWAEQLISRIGWGMESRGKVGNRVPGPTGTAGIERRAPLSLPCELPAVRGQPVGALWPAWLGPCPHCSHCVPAWPLGLFLPLTSRQPGLPVLAEKQLLLLSDQMFCSQPPAPNQGPL